MSEAAAATRRVVGEAERDAAGIRLVQQAERLQHDRVAELRRGGASLLDRAGTARRREGDPGGREQLARLEVAVALDGRRRARRRPGSPGAPALVLARRGGASVSTAASMSR